MNDETPNSTEATPTPDGAENTGNTGPTPQHIPYDRFAEVNRRMKEAEAKAAKFEAAEKERLDKEALAQGNFQKLIDDLKPKAERASELEKTLKGYLDAEVEKIPAAMRDLIPAGDVTAQLAWIQQANAKGLFTRQTAPNTDSGAVGDKKPASVKLTPAQQKYARLANMTDEEYAKHMQL